MHLGYPRRGALQIAHRRLASEAIEHRQIGRARGALLRASRRQRARASWAGLVAAERVERGIGLFLGEPGTDFVGGVIGESARVPGRRDALDQRVARDRPRRRSSAAATRSPTGVRPSGQASSPNMMVSTRFCPASACSETIALSRSCGIHCAAAMARSDGGAPGLSLRSARAINDGGGSSARAAVESETTPMEKNGHQPGRRPSIIGRRRAILSRMRSASMHLPPCERLIVGAPEKLRARDEKKSLV